MHKTFQLSKLHLVSGVKRKQHDVDALYSHVTAHSNFAQPLICTISDP